MTQRLVMNIIEVCNQQTIHSPSVFFGIYEVAGIGLYTEVFVLLRRGAVKGHICDSAWSTEYSSSPAFFYWRILLVEEKWISPGTEIALCRSITIEENYHCISYILYSESP